MNSSLSFLLLLLLTLLLLHLMPPTFSLTVVSSSSDLLDAPQTGFSNLVKTDPHEQQAVYDIMKATGNSWATDIPDVCRGRWHGIECMPDKDNIYHIVSLSFGSLSEDTAFPVCDPTHSFISNSITKLSHLRTLFFYRCLNDNPQPIPTFLSRLGPTLRTLVLRDNGHVGNIPKELGNLTRLEVLDLHNNNLNGSIPDSLNRLTRLRSLDFSANKLTGLIPSGLTTSPVLNILDLNQNHLSGSIPTALGSCISLAKIDLSRNRLSGEIPNEISNLKSLNLLDLGYNCLSGPIPSSLKNMNSLQALILKGNAMDSSTIPNESFDGLNNLVILILSDMRLHGPIPESLGRLPSLRVLHLDGNFLNGSIPKSFADMDSLSELRLNENRLTGAIPFRRELVWRMRRKLKLENNSGLCYGASEGTGDYVDASWDLGIGICETMRGGPARTVEHVFGGDEDRRTVLFKSDAGSIDGGFFLLVSSFVHLVGIFMFVQCLL
ncbi:protein TOO MANY MOUTHS [Impatiens glandulifera]|uniref:protein TOO MANY MOUTHS n=1 Tax=Impatiens glandulifera TaxID=253017 RepID=UPI001FB0A73B|nr:protein TOO MANY MOUTHS [Impatiens glandulifera]